MPMSVGVRTTSTSYMPHLHQQSQQVDKVTNHNTLTPASMMVP